MLLVIKMLWNLSFHLLKLFGLSALQQTLQIKYLLVIFLCFVIIFTNVSSSELSNRPLKVSKGSKSELQSAVAGENSTLPTIEEESSPCFEPSGISTFKNTQSPTTVTFDPKIPVTIPVTLDNLASHVEKCHADDDDPFSDQYKVLRSNCC